MTDKTIEKDISSQDIPLSITLPTEAWLTEEIKRTGLTEQQIVTNALTLYFNEDLSETDKFKLTYYRGEIAHEFNLLGQRLLWYVTSMSLLITSIALVMTTSAWGHRKEFSILLIALGIVISLFTTIAVERAVEVINEWHKKKHIELVGNIDIANISPSQRKWLPYYITRVKSPTEENRDYTHDQSLWISRGLPILFSIVLIIIGVFVYLG